MQQEVKKIFEVLDYLEDCRNLTRIALRHLIKPKCTECSAISATMLPSTISNLYIVKSQQEMPSTIMNSKIALKTLM
jgi:hypothetical protein